MIFEQAVEYIRTSLKIHLDKDLTQPEEEILKAAWDNEHYSKLADSLYLSIGYVKQLAAQLWHEISDALGEKVTKTNFHYIMEQRLSSYQPIDRILLDNQADQSFISTNHNLLIIVFTKNLSNLIAPLKKAGYKVNIAHYRQVFNGAIHHPTDLIILDTTKISIKKAYEICSILSSAPYTSEIPILVLSNSETIEDKVKAFELGAVDYLTKPFNLQELVIRLRTHLAFQQQKQLLKQEIEYYKKNNEILNQSHILLSNVINITLNGIANFSLVRNLETGEVEDFQSQIVNPAFIALFAEEKETFVRNKNFKRLFNKIKPGLFNSLVEVSQTGKPLEQTVVWERNETNCYLCLKAVKFGDGFFLAICNLHETAYPCNDNIFHWSKNAIHKT